MSTSESSTSPPAATGQACCAAPALDPPIACSLRPDALHGQVAAWQQLLTHATTRTAMVDGLRVGFDNAVPTDTLIRLVVAEQACCPFLRFAVTVDTRGVALQITGPDAAADVISALFGSDV